MQLRASAHPSHKNWALKTGWQSGGIVLEVDLEVGITALRLLFQDEWAWRDTLQFRVGHTLFAFFSHRGEPLRILEPRFAGMKIHNGDLLMIPPSRFGLADSVSYTNPHAHVMKAPEQMLKFGRHSGDVAISAGIAVDPYDPNYVDPDDPEQANLDDIPVCCDDENCRGCFRNHNEDEDLRSG
jgi:hypothetical protein